MAGSVLFNASETLPPRTWGFVPVEAVRPPRACLKASVPHNRAICTGKINTYWNNAADRLTANDSCAVFFWGRTFPACPSGYVKLQNFFQKGKYFIAFLPSGAAVSSGSALGVGKVIGFLKFDFGIRQDYHLCNPFALVIAPVIL